MRWCWTAEASMPMPMVLGWALWLMLSLLPFALMVSHQHLVFHYFDFGARNHVNGDYPNVLDSKHWHIRRKDDNQSSSCLDGTDASRTFR
jgi:hypothetical protein